MVKRLMVTLDTGNDAFDGDWRRESARLLRVAAEKVLDMHADDGGAAKLLDANGNTVGHVTVVERGQ
jgi:hypothetical protein